MDLRQVKPRLNVRNKKIQAHLEQYILDNCSKKKVAVLLSGGADSTVVALAAHNVGKKITAFSFQVNGFENEDYNQAKITCEVMGWDFIAVKISKANLLKRFMDLFAVYGCRKKTEAECLFPMLDVIKAVKDKGFSEVLTGFGSFIPTNKNASMQCSRDPVQYWKSRNNLVGKGDSTATEKIIEIAKSHKIKILMPLCHDNMISALSNLSTKDMMGKPYPKHHYKDIYYDDFVAIGTLKGRSGSLQVNGQIEQLFSSLLSNPRFSSQKLSGSLKRQLVTLCNRLGKQTEERANDSLPIDKQEISKIPFKPYSMAAVEKQSKKQLFTVVSLFAGGGGSSTGYKLSGGKIVFANEFVDTAVATYQLNYPNAPVVRDDIRKINRNKTKVMDLFSQFGLRQGDLDILDGSPPCVTFSTSNAGSGKAKMAKKNVVYSDTTQSRIGFLIHDYVFMANVMQPKVCIIENVEGILKSDVFNASMDRLRRYDYIVAFKKMSASDYGAAQKRKRLITLAVRPDVARKVGIRDSDDLLKIFPSPQRGSFTVRQALAGIVIDKVERHVAF